MTRFQKAFLILATAFLAVLVYDRINSYRHEAAAREVMRQKVIWDELYRCEDAIAYPYPQTPEAVEVFQRARQDCQHFWIPQLGKK